MSTKVEPEGLYDAEQVRDFLGLKRKKTVYEIPEQHLPPTWVGPRRGKKMFRGRDVIAYIQQGRRSVAA